MVIYIPKQTLHHHDLNSYFNENENYDAKPSSRHIYILNAISKESQWQTISLTFQGLEGLEKHFTHSVVPVLSS